MIKAIIFDIGGVIQGLDWSPVVNSIIDIKKDLDIFLYQNAIYHDRKKYFDLYATNKLSKKVFWEMVASKLKIRKRYIDDLSKSFELLYSYVDFEVLELLKCLRRNYKLFALSNACYEIEQKAIRDDIYIQLFDKVYFSHHIGYKKPDKKAYLCVTKENGISPVECLFIDNDMKNVKGAQAVGMKGILYKGMPLLREQLNKLLDPQTFFEPGKKKIVGYTTGVFDLFHQGHLNLLRNAKSLCDKLIVGVTTDELSINFKNKKPISSFQERFDIVRAVRYVDLAVPQSTMDKYRAWEQYRFDVLFASGSPTKKWPKVESDFLSHFNRAKAPKIIYLKYTKGVSSSKRRKIPRNQGVRDG